GRDLKGGPAENDVTSAAGLAAGADPAFDFGELAFSIEHPLAAAPAAPAADAPASPNSRLRLSASGRACVRSSSALPLDDSGSARVGSCAAPSLRSSVIGRASGLGIGRVSKPPGGSLCRKREG